MIAEPLKKCWPPRGETCKKAEEENSQLAEEKLSLVIELGAAKDDFTTFREKAAAEKEMMEVAFDTSGDTLFNYGYGCCAFAHNICGSEPEIRDDMPNPSVPLTMYFFANPRCPPSTSVAAFVSDPIAVNGEDCSENSPAAVEDEAALPMAD